MSGAAAALPPPAFADGITWGADGLAPVVVQATDSKEVLLVGSMNREALARTLQEGRLWLWSRARGQLWLKGETSGHYQQVDAVYVNCEANSLLVQVSSLGPACHAGYGTCFYRRATSEGALAVVAPRLFDPAAVYGE
jgi:phosphoribosyl-AMP cyclohydrolase